MFRRRSVQNQLDGGAVLTSEFDPLQFAAQRRSALRRRWWVVSWWVGIGSAVAFWIVAVLWGVRRLLGRG